MKKIFLTQGQYALVDDEDYEWLNQWKWYAHKNRNTFYATRRKGPRNRQQMIRMHRILLGLKEKDGKITDHIDGNGLNNQKHNLRIVTVRENAQNMKNVKTSSQYPGVCFKKSTNKWVAHIYIDGKNKHLGYFEDEYEAYLAYYRACGVNGNMLPLQGRDFGFKSQHVHSTEKRRSIKCLIVGWGPYCFL